MVNETPHIMYVKVNTNDVEEVHEDNKNMLTMLHPAVYDSVENTEMVPCCKFERNMPNIRPKNYESERGLTYITTHNF